MFPLIFGLAFGGFGLVAVLIARATFAKDRAIARWPRAPGKITVSRVETSTGTARDKQGFDYKYTSHVPVVHFTYTVDGRELQGERLEREIVSSSEMPDLSRYPVGQDVMVYYDPNDPQTAYLQHSRSLGAMILGGMGAVFLFVGLLVPTLVLLF